jgi:hypothetical protein
MKLKRPGYSLIFAAFAMLLGLAAVSRAQVDTTPKRLRSSATVRGFIGGESQDHYVIRARKGRKLIIKFSWRKEEDNTAGFSVNPSSSPDSEPLAGQESNEGKTWIGRIPRTGDYLISVTAHPSAHYTLRVTVK